MNITRFVGSSLTAALLLAVSNAWNHSGADAYQPLQPNAEEQMEVLTRGPVHEAFAETVTFDPEPGMIAPGTPPPAIEEVPPDLRPEGVNIAWIPGYWAWDEERGDFLWVSGIWRELPPGRQWVSGYWASLPQGSQWTSGYWADAGGNDVEYLPEPPATVEEGPSTAAVSADHIWYPGCWLWQQDRYVWSPGYWAAAQSDWNWIPPHYVWTPGGYVFVNGYYDYTVARRGVLFAPVYFPSSSYTHRGFTYSPVIVINTTAFAKHLFLRPSYGHYYFGDYYSENYATAGYTPGFRFNASRSGYDPIFAQQRWTHRHDQAWEQSYRTEYRRRRDDDSARPPRTWSEQRALLKAAGGAQQSSAVAISLKDLASSKEAALRYKRLDNAERRQIITQQQLIRQHTERRLQAEAQAAEQHAAGQPERRLERTRLKFQASPITSQPLNRFGVEKAPPKAFASPPDANIERRLRKPHTQDRGFPEVKVRKPAADPGLPPSGERQMSGPGTEPERRQTQEQYQRPSPTPRVDKTERRTERPKPELKAGNPGPRPQLPSPTPKAEKAERRAERPKLESKAGNLGQRPPLSMPKANEFKRPAGLPDAGHSSRTSPRPKPIGKQVPAVKSTREGSQK